MHSEIGLASAQKPWKLAVKVANDAAEPIATAGGCRKFVDQSLKGAACVVGMKLLAEPRDAANHSEHRCEMGQRRFRMGMMMIKCPQTDRAISTGIKADPDSFRSSAVFFGRTSCTLCGSNHEWFSMQAWVDEPSTGSSGQSKRSSRQLIAGP